MDNELRESLNELKKSMDTSKRLDKVEAKVNRWNLFFNIILSIYLVLTALASFAKYLQWLIV